MSLGRIKKTPGKLRRNTGPYIYPRAGPGKRQIKVKVFVQRAGWRPGKDPMFRSRIPAGNYEALACVTGASPRAGHEGCGRFKYGRTVQSAVAKALVSLGKTVALRGRRRQKR